MIRIVQLLCPSRHCVIALAYDPVDISHDDVIVELNRTRSEMRLNPWCGVCGSGDLLYEDAATRFRTMEQAAPHLKAFEAANLATGIIASLINPRNQ